MFPPKNPYYCCPNCGKMFIQKKSPGGLSEALGLGDVMGDVPRLFGRGRPPKCPDCGSRTELDPHIKY